ncbi:MAG: molybdopterin molybdotransferase MoeA [Pseudomonadota bacterium]
MITTLDALSKILALAAPLPVETVALAQAAGRVLAEDVTATRPQPPFNASSMDGYAVSDETLHIGQSYTVVGEAAAGHGYGGDLRSGEAVRIFTGAPVPKPARRVIIQEDVARDGDQITLSSDPGDQFNIRPLGGDFNVGAKLHAPRRLTYSELALLASMNIAQVPVYRQPVVALIATGDELVQPGEDPRDDQIIASNNIGLSAMLTAAGANIRMLPIARDTVASLHEVLSLADGADLVITIGGASVGDHDLVAEVTQAAGLERSFYKVAMRPGKPLMAGRLGGAALVGLPGNPVSALVCGEIFIKPMLDAFLGLPAGPRIRETVPLLTPLPANGPREHYMRARLIDGHAEAFTRQDSSLLTILAEAGCLIVRPPHDPARGASEMVEIVKI